MAIISREPFQSGRITAIPPRVDTYGIGIIAQSGQTADLFQVFNSGGQTEIFGITSTGAVNALNGITSTYTGTNTFSGNVTVSGNLIAVGTSTLSGNVTAKGTLTVTGATTLDSSLAVTGNASAAQIQAVQVTPTVTVSGTNDAISKYAGFVTVSSTGVDAMTLIAPTSGAPGVGDDGVTLTIFINSTHAHTLSCTGTFINGNKTTATFSAIGNSITFVAKGGNWNTVAYGTGAVALG